MQLENFRIGQGYDIHPLIQDRKLILGGVEIPSLKGSFGHSDGDVLSHAIADALLGATSLGDLGKFFPDSDPNIKGITSTATLQSVYQQVLTQGFKLVNVDSTILIAQPKIAPYISPMRKRLSEILETPLERVSVKAKSGNDVGELGKGEAIAAMAIVSIYKV